VDGFAEGFRFDFLDRKGEDDQLREAATIVIGDSPLLANAPAGTIITFSEEQPDDLSFNGQDDWHINFQISPVGAGTYVVTPPLGAIFNSTRSGQVVIIRDAQGTLVTPASGETGAWDEANGGVSGGEVMALCLNPTADMTLDPVTAYKDNGAFSTFGQPNRCVFPDPVTPTQTVEFNQNLSALRATATFGAGSGDANCDLQVSVADAVLASQYDVGVRPDGGPCFFNQGGGVGTVYADGVDMNRDGNVTVADAVIISQCLVGIDLQWCPE